MASVLGRRIEQPGTARAALAMLAGIAAHGRTYLRVCYLLSALPLGLFYFLMLVTLLATGAGTAVVGFGLLLLLATVGLWWGFASFERHLVMWWIGVAIPPMSGPHVPGLPWRQRLMSHLRNPVTWKSLIYLLVDMPFGILAFAVALVLVTLSLSLLLLPVEYMLVTALYHAVGAASGTAYLLNIRVDGQIRLLPLLETLVGSLVGALVGLVSLWALNGVALAWGQFARLMLGMTDTEQRLAEARAAAARAGVTAEHAEQSRRELIVNVSHELRTPIASIRGHAESLLMPESERPAAEQEAYLRIIARESERLSALVDDLLALARADANELRLDLAPAAVADVFEEVYAALSPLAKHERQVTLVRNVPPNLPPVWADRARLAQVLLNLMRNGITYTPAGGIVSLSAERANEGWIVLVVADTGMGIPQDELAHVFERFYRTDASRSRASGGFGLGLSIVKDLVQAMGGGIAAESTLGQGSTFRVLLRVAPGWESVR
jgi:signal transduction histidine kinase